MNIFYLDKNPKRAAQLQYNKHVVKMILESAQMLCTAHRFYGNDDVPYKTADLKSSELTSLPGASRVILSRIISAGFLYR